MAVVGDEGRALRDAADVAMPPSSRRRSGCGASTAPVIGRVRPPWSFFAGPVGVRGEFAPVWGGKPAPTRANGSRPADPCRAGLAIRDQVDTEHSLGVANARSPSPPHQPK